jgi:hypothetical protein
MKNFTRAVVLAIIGGATFLSAGIASAQEVSPVVPVAITLAASGPVAVGTTLETHVNNDGTVVLRGAKVSAINGSVISATQTWGAYISTWVITTDPSTALLRRYGATSSLAEFSVGDYIAVRGTLDTTKLVQTVQAKTIRDYSIQKENATFAGTVLSIDTNAKSILLATEKRGNQTVFILPSTTIKQGGATTTFSAFLIGQKISKATGVWNNLTNTMQAEKVDIYQNTALLHKRTFEGTLKSVNSSLTLPTSIVLTVGKSDFTVNIPAGISVLNKNWLTTPLATYVVGDNVRVYGAVEPTNTSVIDASVVRDASR